jgi:hypothetical protein
VDRTAEDVVVPSTTPSNAGDLAALTALMAEDHRFSEGRVALWQVSEVE